MAYVKFLDSKKFIQCEVTTSDNVVTLIFPKDVVVNTTGFNIYLDKNGEYDIGGTYYNGFKTLYRNDEKTAKYNGYQLSNDGSVYVAPPEPKMPEPIPEPTEEEIAERERLEKISEIQTKVSSLKAELSGSDYIIIKAYEASLVSEALDEYDYTQIHAQRQEIRNRINELQVELVTYGIENTQEV